MRLSDPRLLAALGILLIAGCATPPRETPPAGAQPPAPIAKIEPRPRAQKPPPIPVRPLNVAAECSFRDKTGYAGSMKLAVDDANVRAFDAVVTVPNRGACRFDLKDFRQTRRLPNIELEHTSDRCVVRMWEQGDRVTVAFDQCQKMCSGSAYNHLWPILTDRPTGSCA